MSVLNTIHKRKSFTITSVILVALLFIMFFIGMNYFDPPEESGISVNLGYTDMGSGDVQPLEKIKTAPVQAQTPPPTPVESTEEAVLTDDSQEEVVIPKEEKVKPKEPVTKPVDTKPKEVVKKDPQPSKQTSDLLNSVINGPKNDGTSTNSQGNDVNQQGDKGKAGGDPYANSYFGDPGSGSGGRGWGLNGRGKPTNGKVQQNCNESGSVVVQITVNRQGTVIKAVPGVKGSTNTDPCLLEPAKKTAYTYKWPADANAPAEQIGFIVVNFRLGE